MQGLLCIGLFILGYTIFSDSNLQRKNFRENPGELIWGRPPKVIETESGRKLLASVKKIFFFYKYILFFLGLVGIST